MQVIYLLPFVLVSALAAVVCLLVPRWRRHALASAVAPMAFAGCSIVFMVAVVLTADRLGLERTLDFSAAGSARVFAIAMALYVVPGLAGAAIAVVIVHRLRRWWRQTS
jgi:hypothetical protein